MLNWIRIFICLQKLLIKTIVNTHNLEETAIRKIHKMLNLQVTLGTTLAGVSSQLFRSFEIGFISL